MSARFTARGMLVVLLLAPALARAQSAKEDADALFGSKFGIDEADPSRSIPAPEERDAAPLDFAYFLMNLSERAEAAEKQGERDKQIAYLRALAAAVPNRSIGFSKLCAAFEGAKQYPAAEQSCAAAIALPGATLEDFDRYVRVVFAEERDLDPAQLAQLEQVAAHVRREAPGSPLLVDLECQLAIRTKDAARYATCSAALRGLPDNDVKRLSYSWSWAMARGDYAEAGVLIQRAQESALPSDLVERMSRVRAAQLPWWRRWYERVFASSRAQSH
jgi:hypothetical protein